VCSANNTENALLHIYDYNFNIYYIPDSNICMPRMKVALHNLAQIFLQ